MAGATPGPAGTSVRMSVAAALQGLEAGPSSHAHSKILANDYSLKKKMCQVPVFRVEQKIHIFFT